MRPRRNEPHGQPDARPVRSRGSAARPVPKPTTRAASGRVAHERASKRERFPREYIIDRNGAAAARRSGYSEKTANRIAYTLLKEPAMQQLIADMEAEVAARANLNADHALAETHRIAFDETQPTPSRVRCLEMILRITGKLVDRAVMEATFTVDITDVRNRITGRLARIAAGN